jgi:hypothetical protein
MRPRIPEELDHATIMTFFSVYIMCVTSKCWLVSDHLLLRDFGPYGIIFISYIRIYSASLYFYTDVKCVPRTRVKSNSQIRVFAFQMLVNVSVRQSLRYDPRTLEVEAHNSVTKEFCCCDVAYFLFGSHWMVCLIRTHNRLRSFSRAYCHGEFSNTPPRHAVQPPHTPAVPCTPPTSKPNN